MSQQLPAGSNGVFNIFRAQNNSFSFFFGELVAWELASSQSMSYMSPQPMGSQTMRAAQAHSLLATRAWGLGGLCGLVSCKFVGSRLGRQKIFSTMTFSNDSVVVWILSKFCGAKFLHCFILNSIKIILKSQKILTFNFKIWIPSTKSKC